MKKFLALFAVLCSVQAFFALGVDENELKNVNDQNEIVFINYEGPHAVINSADSIRAIGSEMGTEIAVHPENNQKSGSEIRYQVIHAVDLSVKENLDADILIIGSGAQVDHINNLRRIISGYLSSAYNYSREDADTLAVFITVYNAVYRGYLDLLKNKYKSVVIDNLSPEKCGLSVNYEDWAGNSQIIIPLFDVMNGGLSTIDTSVISDKNVVSSMQEDDDMNIESRKNLVDIKEREADDASQAAKDSQKQAVEEQKKLEEEKQKTADLEKEAEELDAAAKEKQEIAAANPEDKEAQKEAEKAVKAAEDKKEEAAEQKKNEKQQEEKTKDAKETAKEKQALADRKDTEAVADRKEISKDQKTVQDKEAAAASIVPDYALLSTDEKNNLSCIVKFNSANGETVKKSPVISIHFRTFFKSGNNFIAVAGENKNNGAVKLVIIDSENLEITAESEEIISDKSILIQDGSDFYCVISKDGSCYLGKFDSSLKCTAKSAEKVKAGTPVTIASSGIAVTGQDGKLKLLSKADLSTLVLK